MDKKVVGKTTQKLREMFGKTDEAYRAFAFGFAAGQAEKVYLGTCPAAMFRPGVESFEWYLEGVQNIAEIYGLKLATLESGNAKTPVEIWIYKDGVAIGNWLDSKQNSPLWHYLRAGACGIPISNVDTKYHKREGYGKNCD